MSDRACVLVKKFCIIPTVYNIIRMSYRMGDCVLASSRQGKKTGKQRFVNPVRTYTILCTPCHIHRRIHTYTLYHMYIYL